MDKTNAPDWWALHLRVARGESLSATEQAIYTAGLKQRHQDELLNGDLATLSQARQQVAELQTQNEKLQAQRDELDTRIASLEAALGERTRQLLGVEN